ncbi:hypothetical protein BJ508DRAFT_308374 [Ascobolus immersus RN42]|uniref:Uncharacterized protein n=1 Tax=Ascobolus immersus RN42 TaxID=1160509 RepID=A0A3N4I223_ASCIM|nr:hypothetical protein BJ508DRAFT_308374 [Ascobolus immersus RN42]
MSFHPDETDYDSEANCSVNDDDRYVCFECYPPNKTLLITFEEDLSDTFFEMRIRPSEAESAVISLLGPLIPQIEKWSMKVYSRVYNDYLTTDDPEELVLWLWEGFQLAVQVYRVLAANREVWEGIAHGVRRVQVDWQPPDLEGTRVEAVWKELWVEVDSDGTCGYRGVEISRKTVEKEVKRAKEVIRAYYSELELEDWKEPVKFGKEDEGQMGPDRRDGHTVMNDQKPTVPTGSRKEMKITKQGQEHEMEANSNDRVTYSGVVKRVQDKSTQTEDEIIPSQSDDGGSTGACALPYPVCCFLGKCQ